MMCHSSFNFVVTYPFYQMLYSINERSCHIRNRARLFKLKQGEIKCRGEIMYMKKKIMYGIIGWTLAVVLGIMHFQQEEISALQSVLYLIGTLIAMIFIFSSLPKKEIVLF